MGGWLPVLSRAPNSAPAAGSDARAGEAEVRGRGEMRGEMQGEMRGRGPSWARAEQVRMVRGAVRRRLTEAYSIRSRTGLLVMCRGGLSARCIAMRHQHEAVGR